MTLRDEMERQARLDEALVRVAELERTLRAVSTALPVLRTMCGAAGLEAGKAKAEEMIGWIDEALRLGPERELS